MKFKNKLAAACTALLLGLGSAVAFIAPAVAEETPPPAVSVEAETPAPEAVETQEPVVEETQAPVEAPAPEVEPAPEVVPAPAPVEAPEEVVVTDAQPQAPPVAAKQAPKSVCVSHGGSDGVTPYSVTKDGLTLPAGCFFEDNGHVNIKTSVGPKNIHFESRNNQPSGQWIGQSFLPWSAFGLNGDFCVTWVQMSAFNEHFGEGGQKPVCTTPPFEVKEVCATWETQSVSKDWPQTILSKDCNFVPEQRCEPYKIQFDKYWIRDAADQAYFDSLTGLNSAADDQSLEPHGYYLKVIEAKDCAPALIEIPYPTMLANEVCGAQNDPVFTDPEWVKQYGSLVNGPWIDTKYKNQDGKWVVDGSAQIKPEFRKTHIWAGTAGTDKSSFLRWQMYPGTTPFVHEDIATACPPVEVPANPVADITAVCGAADITLGNPQKDGEANKTASFVVNVDGKFYGSYSVAADASETVKLAFDEDSGDHKVEVFQSGTSEWKKIAEATVESDCVPPKPDTKIEFSNWVDGEFECTATEVPQTRTKSVTEYVLVDGQWVAGETVVTTENGSRPLTDAEQKAADIECAGPQPEPKVVTTDWADGEFVCGDETVTQTRTITTTTYVWDAETKAYVEDETTVDTESRERELTEQERQDVCVKPEPTNGVEKRALDPICVEPNNGTATVEHQERTWTQTPVWNGTDWTLGEKQYSDWTTVSTSTVDSEDCEVVVPPKPDDEVTEQIVKPLIPCDAVEGDEIATTITVTTTTYTLVDGKWVAGEPVTSSKSGVYVVTAADAEAAECPVVVPPKPEDKVTKGEWAKPSINCTAEEGDTIAITREVTTTPYVLVDNEWVLDTANAVVTNEDGTYTVTAEDIDALNCPVPPTEPEEPTTPTEPEETTAPVASEEPTKAVTPAAVIDVLAATGANPIVQLWAFTGGALMVALGALAMLFNARRRQLAQQGTTED